MPSNSWEIEKSLFELPFDQFSRQYIAKELVESVRTKKRLRILDVGGYKGKTAEFFPSDEVIILDVFDIDAPNYIKGSGLALPFDDGSFDFVVCFDVYEHIPRPDRQKFIEEMNRVTRSHLLVAAPFDTEHVADAEVELNRYYTRLNGSDHRWLKEHIDYGLSEPKELENVLKTLKLHFVSYSSNNIHLWTAFQNLIFLSDKLGSPEKISAVNKYYNQNLLALGDQATPAYRQIFFASNAKIPAKNIKKPLQINHTRIRKLTNLVFESIRELVFSYESVVAHEAELDERDLKITQLQSELATIYASRSWAIVQKLKKIKRLSQKISRRKE